MFANLCSWEAAAEAGAEAAPAKKELKAKKTELNRWQRTLLHLLQQIPTEADDKKEQLKTAIEQGPERKTPGPATRRMRMEKPTGMVTGFQW